MADYSPVWSTFNDGELSPLLEGRVEIPQYMRGGKTMLNFLPTVQGPMVRRGGSRYIGNPAVPADPSVLIRFSRSQTNSYVLSFCDRCIRFYFNGALVTDTFGTPYIVHTPYTQADLFDADGLPQIVAAESEDVVYLAHPKYPPQVLSFLGPNNWTLFPLKNVDGPWNDGNSNQSLTVYVSGGVQIGSTVTITASANIFKAGHVGTIFRIHQKDLSSIKPWAPGQRTPVVSVGVQRRSGFNTYQCTNASPGLAPSGGSSLLFVQTGPTTLLHTKGNAWDGDQTTTIDPIGANTYYSTGMQWAYQDCGYGVVRITGYIDDQHVTGTVLRQMPLGVVGAANVSWIWEMGAWNGVDGYPSQVTFFRQRLTFAGRQRVWCSVVGDFENFADMDFGQVLPDSAVTVQCLSDQVNTIVALSPADTLLVITTGGEFTIGQQSISDPFGPENVLVALQSSYGGRAVVPIRVQQYTLFVQKNGRSVRESSFAFAAGPTGSYVSNDLTVLSEHITQSGIIATAWARNPHTIVYMVLGDGSLIGFTYNPEQSVKAWHRHDVGGGGKVVALCVVPNGSGDWDDVYIEVRRVIDDEGDVNHTIERLEQEFSGLPGANQQDAFYVDCGLTLNNTINAALTPGDSIFGSRASPTNATNTGATGVLFQADLNVFVAADVGRFIHYDWTTTRVGDDGLSYPLATKAIAEITDFVSAQEVRATIIAPWPNTNQIPANGWRMTVTSFFGSGYWGNNVVSILADGATTPDQLSSFTGTQLFTLAVPASIVQAGLKSPAVWQSMKPDGGDREGSAVGKKRRVVKATIRVLTALGLKLGRDLADLDPIEMRDPTIADDNPPPLFTGDTERQSFEGIYDRAGRIMLMCDQPLPMTVCALAARIQEQEDG